MARINTSRQGGASLPTDASPGRKRRRGGDDHANDDANNDRASKRPRKEGKSKGGQKPKEKNMGPSADEPRRSGRDRNSGDGSNWWQTAAPNADSAAESPAAAAAKETRAKPAKGAKGSKGAKAGRPAKTTKAIAAAEVAQPDKPSKAAKEKTAKAKAARAEKAANKQAEGAATADTADTTRDKPRRGRPRASNASAEAATDATATKSLAAKTKKAKVHRKPPSPSADKPPPSTSKAGRGSARTARADPPSATASPQSRPQPRQTVEEGEEQEEEEEEEGDDDDDDDGGDSNVQQPFRQLVPRTRLVPLATMASKWAPLDRDAIAAVQALLDECARPVLARLGSSAEKKDRQDIARQAVTGVTRRLRSKLVKGIPFPTDGTGGKTKSSRTRKAARSKTALDSSRVSFLSEPTAETHALQSQLTPLQHAVALLESERRREEAALADEYAQLRALETNAQAELRTWRERQRRQHVLAGGAERESSSMHKDGKDEKDEKDEAPSLFSDSFDSSVVDLASLSNHMESVRGNMQQIDGLAAAMVRSRAALQDVLGERLSGEQYERVLLGR